MRSSRRSQALHCLACPSFDQRRHYRNVASARPERVGQTPLNGKVLKEQIVQNGNAAFQHYTVQSRSSVMLVEAEVYAGLVRKGYMRQAKAQAGDVFSVDYVKQGTSQSRRNTRRRKGQSLLKAVRSRKSYLSGKFLLEPMKGRLRSLRDKRCFCVEGC